MTSDVVLLRELALLLKSRRTGLTVQPLRKGADPNLLRLSDLVKAGVGSERTLSRIENGQGAHVLILLRLLEHYGLLQSFWELLEEKDSSS